MFSKFRTPFWNPGRFHDRKHSVNKVPSMRELENLKPIFIKLYDGSLVCLDRKILKCTEGSNPSLSARASTYSEAEEVGVGLTEAPLL